jgi:hypothetical protein
LVLVEIVYRWYRVPDPVEYLGRPEKISLSRLAAHVERLDIFDVNSAKANEWFRFRAVEVNEEDFGSRFSQGAGLG